VLVLFVGILFRLFSFDYELDFFAVGPEAESAVQIIE